jgi:hypothetical protein
MKPEEPKPGESTGARKSTVLLSQQVIEKPQTLMLETTPG